MPRPTDVNRTAQVAVGTIAFFAVLTVFYRYAFDRSWGRSAAESAIVAVIAGVVVWVLLQRTANPPEPPPPTPPE